MSHSSLLHQTVQLLSPKLDSHQTMQEGKQQGGADAVCIIYKWGENSNQNAAPVQEEHQSEDQPCAPPVHSTPGYPASSPVVCLAVIHLS
eukprot:1158052-Pelagomonas_calceolata.AAC.2